MAITAYFNLDDIGLFRTPRIKGESVSQYDRALAVRNQFGHCMEHAEINGCIMPFLCAMGEEVLSCAHLHVDYSGLSRHKMRLTGPAQKLFDARLRATGTQRYREMTGHRGPLPGDIHLAALKRISSFPGRRKARARRAAKGKERGFFGRLLGF